jgi:hypothetical protein
MALISCRNDHIITQKMTNFHGSWPKMSRAVSVDILPNSLHVRVVS